MLFLKFSNANILFGKNILMKKIYTINMTLLITNQVQIINKKNLVIIVLDANSYQDFKKMNWIWINR